jgi:hypothetical protein
MKLKDIGIIVPALSRRYYFHSTYKKLAARNRTYGRININEPGNDRAISLVAATKEFATLLNSPQRERLRARIIESLDPDRDIREFEHEMRAFVHYKGAGYGIFPSDDDEHGRFDFLIKGNHGEFELECKTFSENIGNAISVDDSIHVFRAFKAAIVKDKNFRECGILTLTFPARVTMSEKQLTELVSDFLSNTPAERHRDGYSITFEKRPDWDILLRSNNHQVVVDDIAGRFAEHNAHSITMLSSEHAVMGVVRSQRRARPATSIFDRLKSASEQFSKERPAVVWGHFLGFGQDEFREFLEERRLGHKTLDVFGHYLFSNPNRNHICRLRLSAEGNLERSREQNGIFIRPNVTNGRGLAYDLTSNVSRFDSGATQ